MRNCRITAFAALLQLALAMFPDAAPGTRHIWQKPPGKDIRIKFLDVPNAYDDALVKHADLAGMLDVYTNGQTWQVMDGKRLSQLPTDGTVHPRAVQHSTEVAIMGAEELWEVLKTKPSYEELHSDVMRIMQGHEASDSLVERDLLDCTLVWCARSSECTRASDSEGICNNCIRHDCEWHRGALVNFIHNSPNEVGDEQSKDAISAPPTEKQQRGSIS